MKKVVIVASSFVLAACGMTNAELQSLTASMNSLNQSAQGWAQSAQQSQGYVAPTVPNYNYGGGVTYSQVGNTVVGSNGVTYRKVGSTIIGSDGTTCQIVGQQLICR